MASPEPEFKPDDNDWYDDVRGKEDEYMIHKLIYLSPLELITSYPVYYYWVMSYKDKLKIPYTMEGLPVVPGEKLKETHPLNKKRKVSVEKTNYKEKPKLNL